jgi:hypothetical protein
MSIFNDFSVSNFEHIEFPREFNGNLISLFESIANSLFISNITYNNGWMQPDSNTQ